MFEAEFRDDVRIAVPAIAEHLKGSHSDIREAAIKGLLRLVGKGIC